MLDSCSGLFFENVSLTFVKSSPLEILPFGFPYHFGTKTNVPSQWDPILGILSQTEFDCLSKDFAHISSCSDSRSSSFSSCSSSKLGYFLFLLSFMLGSQTTRPFCFPCISHILNLQTIFPPSSWVWYSTRTQGERNKGRFLRCWFGKDPACSHLPFLILKNWCQDLAILG